MISKIHSTTVLVADQDAAIDFYVNKLGWKISIDAMVGEEMRFLTVVPPGGGAELALLHEQFAGEGQVRGGHTGIAMTSENIDETYNTLVERGVRFRGPVETMPWGDKAAWFFDVDDNEFFLTEG